MRRLQLWLSRSQLIVDNDWETLKVRFIRAEHLVGSLDAKLLGALDPSVGGGTASGGGAAGGGSSLTGSSSRPEIDGGNGTVASGDGASAADGGGSLSSTSDVGHGGGGGLGALTSGGWGMSMRSFGDPKEPRKPSISGRGGPGSLPIARARYAAHTQGFERRSSQGDPLVECKIPDDLSAGTYVVLVS